MKSFWIAYAFWFVTTFIICVFNQDFINASAWSFIFSLGIYIYFEFFFFEEREGENEEDEYITIWTKKD